MKILVIGQYYPPDIGGSHRRTYNAVKGLEIKGHEIEIITAFPHYPLGKVPLKYNRKILSIEHEGNHRVIRVWMPKIAHQGFSRRLLMYILFSITALLAIPLVKRPDVIWAASPNVFSSIPSKIYSIIMRAPVVRNIDDLWPETATQLGYLGKKIQRIGEFGAKLAYHLSSALTPISPAYQPILEMKYGISPSRIFVAEVGVDTNLFKANRQVVSKKTDQFLIVYSGLLGVAYDFNTILEAAKKLHRNDQTHFLIRGVGEMEQFIRSKIKENFLHNITLSTEFLEQTALIELLAKADALLLPMKENKSSDIGIPTKMFEYMACGRPIICISAGESARIIEAAKCGVVVRPNDPDMLCSVIRDLQSSMNLEEIGRNGQEYVENHFSLKNIATKLEAAFHYAINR